MQIKYLTFLFLPFVQFGLLQAQTLSAVENRLVKTIEANNEEALTFLEEVVNINSGTMNIQGVEKVGKEFQDAFDRINFKTDWLEMPKEMNRAGHLVAKIKGSKGKRLLLIGHLDTVFEEDSPFQKFKKVNNSLAFAPGGNDMKGGNIIVLYALKALHENGLLDDVQITVIFTGDEEKGGYPTEIARKDLIEIAKKSDVALGFEPSKVVNTATVARRGATYWKLEVKGTRSHSSRIFNEQNGAGAIFEMSRIINAFYEELKGEEYLTFNPSVSLGGTTVNYNESTNKGDAFGKTNVIPQAATVQGDLRFISTKQKESTIKKMKAIVSKNLPQTTAQITFKDFYPAMPPTEGNYALLKTLNKVGMDLGQGEILAFSPGGRGAADISHVAEYVDCLDGLGAEGGGTHTIEEFVNLNTIEALTKRTAILIYRLINQ
jgi:glutamate carboxypeptidase